MSVSDQAKDWLAEHGYQPEFGARPLRRTVQRELDNRLSSLLLGGQAKEGDTVEVDVSGGGLEVKVAAAQAA
ncbi:hypothetical protein [Nonomuraea dietziae]|uniref:hypothetical protein n=1 Tax=Nonomuraea dietziae TaxID=65515 RepID=UPI0031D0ED0E